MKLLAIDTSANACSVALMLDDEIIQQHEIAAMLQAQRILPMINKMLRTSGVSLKNLDALAFGCGPGSFTGVRIATSVMQGLAFAGELPLIPVSSLAAVAQAAYVDLDWKKLLVAVDARISEIYWGKYIVGRNGLVELQGEESVIQPAKIIFPIEEDWYGVGNGWDVYRDTLSFKPLAIDASRLPIASAILTLARDKYSRREWVAPEDALPVYLRNNVAVRSSS
jgi:tRNA threonylcarbamoyladenosine biosynthesis protein TsaB